MRPHLHVNQRVFRKWQLVRHAPPPPYKVSKVGRVFILTPITNERLNIAHGLNGVVLFTNKNLAQYVLSIGLLPAS